jgi:flagellar basal-body rod modification protein FlgD
MSSVPGINMSTPSAESQFGKGLNDLNMDEFLKLMITELQNQDPLDPMDNAQLLEQLSQIRDVGATDKLTETLDTVLLGQNITTASSLIGQSVRALSDDGADVVGQVDRVTVEPGTDGAVRTIRIHVGQSSVSLNNIREILPLTQQ